MENKNETIKIDYSFIKKHAEIARNNEILLGATPEQAEKVYQETLNDVMITCLRPSIQSTIQLLESKAKFYEKYFDETDVNKLDSFDVVNYYRSKAEQGYNDVILSQVKILYAIINADIINI